jgi:hypothetical protein
MEADEACCAGDEYIYNFILTGLITLKRDAKRSGFILFQPQIFFFRQD